MRAFWPKKRVTRTPCDPTETTSPSGRAYDDLLVSPANKHTPSDFEAIIDDDLGGPSSTARPVIPLFSVPWLAVTVEGLRFLPLDARAAYVLSLVDGHHNVETMLDVCAQQLTRDDALDVLAHLLQLGAIELRDP
jgi:hypothetical protein